MGKSYHFSGWATKNNIKCADGKTILPNAFKNDDGQTVPLVWNHQHNSPDNILGHALLENRADGVYAYCTFNDTESAKDAKALVEHGDVDKLSIYANKLKQKMGLVEHGQIREVSLVLAGANPGAFIDTILSHGDNDDHDFEAYIYTNEELELYHSEDKSLESEELKIEEDKKQMNNEKTIGDVFDELTEEQKNVVYAMIGMAVEEANNANGEYEDEEEVEELKQNAFYGNDNFDEILTHADMEEIMSDAKRYGSLKDAVLQHGITNIDYLFPEEKTLEGYPTFVQRDMGWVQKVMDSVHNTPFSRIKSMSADITEDEARAKGYIKGKLKKEEVFSLLKRTTTPTTIYKKQKLDRDDVIDITDFDVVAWLKSEMRTMLDEEIARAILIGDGRLGSDDDKINESNIRPIAKDAALYSIPVDVEITSAMTADEKAKKLIREIIKARKNYKGSGSPTFYTTEDVLTDLLLLEDNNGRVIYESQEKLAIALRVKEIISVPPMEGTKIDDKNLLGIVVNLADYNVGADKGGAVNMFDDFDIDYNAQKYLIETRCSGALTKPLSAIVFTEDIDTVTP